MGISAWTLASNSMGPVFDSRHLHHFIPQNSFGSVCDGAFTVSDESPVHKATLVGDAQVYALRFLKAAIEGLS